MSATSVSDLKHSLRSLIASSSMEAVYTSLTQVMKEDYEFLQKFYAATPPAPSSAVAASSSAAPSPTTVLKKKVAKKSSTPLVPSSGAEPVGSSALQ